MRHPPLADEGDSLMEMVSIRCKNPHPRLVGKPCNAMIEIGATAGQVQLVCWRCGDYVMFNFEKAGTEAAALTN